MDNPSQALNRLARINVSANLAGRNYHIPEGSDGDAQPLKLFGSRVLISPLFLPTDIGQYQPLFLDILCEYEVLQLKEWDCYKHQVSQHQ